MALNAAQQLQVTADLTAALNGVENAMSRFDHAAQIRREASVSADTDDATDRASCLVIATRLRALLGMASP